MDRLHVEILPDGITARLIAPYTVTVDGADFTVPVGFVTDFASVPRFLWCILPPWGKYSSAAVVHDYLYRTHQVSRKQADKIFLKLMEGLGVPWWKRRVMYRAVRMFGSRAWKKYKGK